MNQNGENLAVKPKIKPKKQAVYIKHLPPCNSACPAGANIQSWLQAAKKGDFRLAFDRIVENHPFPAIMGRVCYHRCENACNRAIFDEAVNIHAIERFIGDLAIAENWKFPKVSSNGKKVLIIGAGPAGLATAYHLRKSGVDVTIFEALPKAGGMLRYGIPSYRLPRDILDKEVQRILDMGVIIEYNHKVTDLMEEKSKGAFDAVYISIGAHLGKNLNFPHDNSVQILDAVEYLREHELGVKPKTVESLMVYGGGNTATDVARVALRLGAREVNLVYHRTREKMPAFAAEVDEALEEKVKLNFLRTILRIENKQVILSVNELDDKGAPKPTGKTETLPADILVLALSQVTDVNFLRNIAELEITDSGTIVVDEVFKTGCTAIFAGGDVVPYDRSVTVALGHGKHAARSIMAYLAKGNYVKPPKNPSVVYEDLHITSEKSAKATQDLLDPEIRKQSFVEVMNGITKDQVLVEAVRCFSCGNCFECDGCYMVCPVKAISKLGPGKGYSIDYNKCIGCGKCVKRCPCGAIRMKDTGS